MKCKCGCGKDVDQIAGKQAREFYSDACRKRFNRGQKATADTPTPDKSTADTQPRTTPDKPAAGPICGHCGEPTLSYSMTCCLACSMAGKGPVSDQVKRELGIGQYAPVQPQGQPQGHDGPDCPCMHCTQARANNGSNNHIWHGELLTAGELQPGQVNRVSLPGDLDYA